MNRKNNSLEVNPIFPLHLEWCLKHTTNFLYGHQMTKLMIVYSEKLWKVQVDGRWKKKKKKPTNTQTNKPDRTGISKNQTNGVRNKYNI